MTSPITSTLTRPLTYPLTKPLGTIMGQGGVVVPPTFQSLLDYANFGGDGWASRGGELTGAADTFVMAGLFAGWPPFRTDGAAQEILRTNLPRGCRLVRSSGNKFEVQGITTGGTNMTLISTNNWYAASTGAPNWVAQAANLPKVFHFNMNVAAASKIGRLWENWVEDTGALTNSGAGDGTSGAVKIDLTGQTDWNIGATNAAASKFTGMMQALMFWQVAIDWSNPSIMALSGDVVNGLADPGAPGGLFSVVGTPLIYLRLKKSETADQFLVNRGTGGSFTMKTGLTVGKKTGGNIGQRSRPLIGIGNSLQAGTAATVFPDDTSRRITAELCSPPRMDINAGIGGQTLVDNSGGTDIGGCITLRTTAWAAGNVIPNPADSTVGDVHYVGEPLLWIPGQQGPVFYPLAKYRLEGGYNDRLITIQTIIDNAIALKTALIAAGVTDFYYVGIPVGGQRVVAGGVLDLEEYGNGTDNLTGGFVYNQLVAAGGANPGILAAYGADRFFDPRKALIGGFNSATGLYTTDPYDTTPDPNDGAPLGSYALAVWANTNDGKAFDVTTHQGDGTDTFDLAHGVPLSTFRALQVVSGGSRPGYNIHWNSCGHYVEGWQEFRYRVSRGINN